MYKKLIVSEAEKQGIASMSQLAYILATVDHETNKTFKPVKEAYWLSENWRKANLRYYPYYGRGFVQITWKTNYRKFSEITGRDLVKNPDLALEPDISAYILVYGMKHGSFTSKKLSDFINEEKVDFVSARRIINGLDKAEHISKIASKYLLELNEVGKQ